MSHNIQILDGKVVRETLLPILINKVERLSFLPHLVIIQVGNREDSTAFIRAKKIFANKIGVKETHIIFSENILEKDFINEVKKYSDDNGVHGIIVQLPLPDHIDSNKVIEKINPEKDVDGLTKNATCISATARGIRELLQFYNIELNNKKVAIIGRSKLVGIPIAMMCKEENAFVTVCHSKTKNIKELTKKARILIVAIGKPHLINRDFINKKQIVIDVGINRMPDGKLAGDVDFEDIKNSVAMITPVPGGVGAMTVLALFENLIDLCYNPLIKNKIEK